MANYVLILIQANLGSSVLISWSQKITPIIIWYFKGCKYPNLVGDGYCNDESNNIHCAFDRGDCCYSKLAMNEFCSDCQCLTGEFIEEINHPLIGDGYCHDKANNASYTYDG